MIALILGGVVAFGVIVFVGFVLWFTKVYVNRGYSNRPTVHGYEVGEVYQDRDGDLWKVVSPGYLELRGLGKPVLFAADYVEKYYGPLTLVREAGERL